MSLDSLSVKASGAFVHVFNLPPTGCGTLDGLTFTVKDNIDVAGFRTSFGSPAWRDAHPEPVHNAVCVDQLLASGATCIGKVVADEFTYSLDGESHFFGTPLNATAPDRIPGGSSSGSASSVACGLTDYSIGTDSGGSIRVPASLCGVWGMRPSLHRVSEAGVLPFMPSVSTVGAVSRSLEVLNRAMRVMLKSGTGERRAASKILLLEDAFELSDESVAEAAREKAVRMAKKAGIAVGSVWFREIAGYDLDLVACNVRALRDMQTAEVQNTVGNWIENNRPEVSPTFSLAWGPVTSFDRRKAMSAMNLCERLYESINRFLGAETVVCFPTTPTIAPLKGSLSGMEAVSAFYDRTMAITSFSGVGRLSEISAPILTVERCPVGLSFAAAHYRDEFLLEVVGSLCS